MFRGYEVLAFKMKYSWGLRALAALTEDPGSNPSTHRTATTICLTLVLGDLMLAVWSPPQALYARDMQTRGQNTRTPKIKNNILKINKRIHSLAGHGGTCL